MRRSGIRTVSFLFLLGNNLNTEDSRHGEFDGYQTLRRLNVILIRHFHIDLYAMGRMGSAKESSDFIAYTRHIIIFNLGI